MDLRQTREYGEYMRRRGWVVERVGKNQVFLKKLPLLPFWVLKAQRYEKELSLKRMQEVIRKYWIIYRVLEPLSQKGVLEGFKLNKNSFLPTKTIIVDLNQSKEKLWQGLKKDVRQQLKKENGVMINNEKDLFKFRYEWRLMRKGYIPSILEIWQMKASFEGKMMTLTAKLEGEMIAGMIVLFSKETAYYYFAWTNERGRRVGAQYRLVWEGMMRAKKKKMKYWDFEGIDDERFQRNSWKGFSLFKKKFGGKQVSFPGSFVKWI